MGGGGGGGGYQITVTPANLFRGKRPASKRSKLRIGPSHIYVLVTALVS